MAMVEEILTLSSGNNPVRINQIASTIIPRFLVPKVSVIGMTPPFVTRRAVLRWRQTPLFPSAIVIRGGFAGV